jgi:tetratricopeptide (TPR) repeat protein
MCNSNKVKMSVPKRALATVVLMLFFCLSAVATQFNFTDYTIAAQEYISLFKMKKAQQFLDLERTQNPGNATVDYLENYIDFYRLISTQDPSLLKQLQQNQSKRTARIQKCNTDNPYKLFAQAEINIQWGFVQALTGELMSAALNFRSAYKLLEENMKLFPNFTPNKKNMGMLQALIGTMPENYSWILKIVGMNGDFSKGMQMLDSYVKDNTYSNTEILNVQSGQYYYILLQLNFGNRKDCWKYTDVYTTNYQNSPLLTYLRAFTAMKSGLSDEAIKTLRNRPSGSEYIAFPILDYLQGVALLNVLHDDAPFYLKKYVSFSKGSNLIKDAYMRLSWYYYLNGNNENVTTYKQLALKYGALHSDEDKKAQKECSKPYFAPKELLKVRLLQDGGNYVQALKQLEAINKETLHFAEIAEYNYRKGRILHETGAYARAIECYKESIAQSKGINVHFAPFSCFYIGTIYETNSDKDLALNYYNKVFNYKNFEYKSSIYQKARAGINRLSN